MSNTEMWIEAIANGGVCLLCVITTSILLSTWYQVDNRSYPKWALVAIGLLYFGYCIRRLLNVIQLEYPIWSVIVVWDCISVVCTTVGMIGQIALARWARVRTGYYSSIASNVNHKIAEKEIAIKELQTYNTLLETKIILMSDRTAV